MGIVSRVLNRRDQGNLLSLLLSPAWSPLDATWRTSILGVGASRNRGACDAGTNRTARLVVQDQ
jgi:hypothetical protein